MKVVEREKGSYYKRLNLIMSKLVLKADYDAGIIYYAWDVL